MTRSTRIALALGLNAVLVLVEVATALGAHSASLLSDAGHNVTDVAALVASLVAVRWAMRPRSDSRTFGNHRGTILVALGNSALLAVVTVVIVVISVIRLVHPHPVHGWVMVAVAPVAIAVNLAAALVLRDRTRDLNLRAAVLHMAADALAAAAVLVAGIAIALGGPAWYRADPAAALAVSVLIIVEAARLTTESVHVLLESVPADLELGDLRRAITDTPGVAELHDLHVWSLSSDVRALSAHLVLTGHPTLEEAQAVGRQVRDRIEGPFEIAHSTFELECERCVDDLDDPCRMDELAVSTANPVVNRTAPAPTAAGAGTRPGGRPEGGPPIAGQTRRSPE
jgi:cobalt-zinc-cadmium efflux system protein